MCYAKLGKCFVSCALVLLLSFGSLVPCWAENYGADGVVETMGSVGFFQYTQDFYTGGFTIPVPVAGMYLGSSGVRINAGMWIKPCFNSRSDFIFDQDYTLYFHIAPALGSNDVYKPISFNNEMSYTDLPEFTTFTNRPDNDGMQQTVTRIWAGDFNIQSVYSPMYRVTVPSTCNNFECYYPDNLFTVNSGVGEYELLFAVECFQFIPTTEPAILGVLDSILEKVSSIDVNTGNILAACNDILVQLQSLNADTDTIITLLQTLESLSTSQLTQLENISSSVDAIYYFLTQEMKTESDKLSGEAASVGSGIDNNHAAEVYYQTSMQGSYDSLDLDNFSFGGIAGGLELVGKVFSDIWDAFGAYNIVFSFPLVLGICLLVIGRVSRYDTQKRREERYERRRAERRNNSHGKGG